VNWSDVGVWSAPHVDFRAEFLHIDSMHIQPTDISDLKWVGV